VYQHPFDLFFGQMVESFAASPQRVANILGIITAHIILPFMYQTTGTLNFPVSRRFINPQPRTSFDEIVSIGTYPAIINIRGNCVYPVEKMRRFFRPQLYLFTPDRMLERVKQFSATVPAVFTLKSLRRHIG
jgi:hypothetical protein